jgi:hypothetical protein
MSSYYGKKSIATDTNKIYREMLDPRSKTSVYVQLMPFRKTIVNLVHHDRYININHFN